jgi:uncharacterized membrane protein
MTATTYRDNDNHLLQEARLPLLMIDEIDDIANEHHDTDIENIQNYAFSLGLLVGTFMQLTTLLGANFLVISIWSQEGLPTKLEGIGLPVLYGFVMSTMVVVVLVCIRKLVLLVYIKSNGRTKKSEDAQQDFLRKFERRFITGAICGACMVSAATSLIGSIIVYPIILTWLSCYVFFCCCDSGNDDDDEENEQTSEDDLHIRSSGGYQNCMVV